MDEARRRFLGYFSSIGLGGSLLPGALWAQTQQSDAPQITLEMLQHALKISGFEFSEDDEKAMLNGVNQNLNRYQEIHDLKIPNDVSPPFYFSSITPGMKVNRTREPLVFSAPAVKRPANIEDLAFASVVELAHLLKTRKVTSVELTEMYLGAAAQVQRQAELRGDVSWTKRRWRRPSRPMREIAAGKYHGPLHGDSVGRERHHRGEGLQDHVGVGRI